MPSPLSGFTQPAASPTSAQLGPATPETAPPIGSSAEDVIRTSGPRAASPRGGLGVVLDQRAQPRCWPAGPRWPGCRRRCSLRRRPAGTPSRSRTSTSSSLAAQLQVRGDPLVVAAAGADVAPRGHPERGVAVPHPPEHPAQVERAPSATTSRWQATVCVPPSAVLEHHAGDPVAVARDVDRPGALQRRSPRSSAASGSGRRARAGAPRRRGRAASRRARAAPAAARTRPRAARGSCRGRAPSRPGRAGPARRSPAGSARPRRPCRAGRSRRRRAPRPGRARAAQAAAAAPAGPAPTTSTSVARRGARRGTWLQYPERPPGRAATRGRAASHPGTGDDQ